MKNFTTDTTPMPAGTLVRVRKEWLAPYERDIPYLVLEDREDRVLVQDLPQYSRNRAFLGTYCWPKSTLYVQSSADEMQKLAADTQENS